MGIFRHLHSRVSRASYSRNYFKSSRFSARLFRGDTLIEVTLAITVFSAVSVLTIASMNRGISQAQAALEVTLARSEIDAQSEAIRFIHNSYVADKSSNDGVAYNAIWKKIAELAINYGTYSAPSLPQIAVSNCQELYASSGTNSLFSRNAFIINTRRLGRFSASNSDNTLQSVIIPAKNTNKFYPATLYPRIIYSNGSEDGVLYENDDSNNYYNNVARVEGLYTIAARANDNTFYDFYTYTCWYPPNADNPTTIGTAIRLYNPEVTAL